MKIAFKIFFRIMWILDNIIVSWITSNFFYFILLALFLGWDGGECFKGMHSLITFDEILIK